MMSPFKTMRTVLTRLITSLLCAPIHFYRRFLSPLMPPACRFQPSCSAYALEAIKLHGPARGLWLAARRLRAAIPSPGSADRRVSIPFLFASTHP